MRRNTVDSWSSQVVPLEAEEQKWLLQWVELNTQAHPELSLFYHIPNEGKRSWQQGRALKDQGMKKGVPDNCLPVARGKYHALYIELKRTRGGRPSAEQIEWIDALNQAGNRAVICEGWEEAAQEIMRYLKGGVYR